MSLTTIKLNHILEKIRTLSKECNLNALPSKIPAHDHPRFENVLDEYLKALDDLREKFYEFHQTTEEYKKLQEVLQKNETQIRKHIGIEQELKLYIETLKGQYEESEMDRLDLLDNSKKIIKSLKSQNEKMYQKLKEFETLKYQAKPKSSHKKIPNPNERFKTDNFASVYGNHNNKLQTEPEFMSPSRKKKNISDFEGVDLTDRVEPSHKKKLNEIKKKQLPNHTLSAYSNPQKKRHSREKNVVGKKNLSTFTEMKKIGVTSGFKVNQRSNKKVNKSIFSVPESDHGKDFSHRKKEWEDFEKKQTGPHISYFSPDFPLLK